MDGQNEESDGFVSPYYYSSDRPLPNYYPQPIIPCSSNLLRNAAAMRDSCSDSDSGICADNNSDGQLSPRRQDDLQRNRAPPLPKKPQLLPPHLRINPIFPPTMSDRWQNNIPNLPTPQNCGSTTNSGRNSSRSAPLRVRFADQVCSDSASSSTSSRVPPIYQDACRRIQHIKQSQLQPQPNNRDLSGRHVRSRSLPRATSGRNLNFGLAPPHRIITAPPEISSLSSARSVDDLVHLAPLGHSFDEIIELQGDPDPLPPPHLGNNKCTSFENQSARTYNEHQARSRFDASFGHYLGKVRGRTRSQHTRSKSHDRQLRAPPLDPEHQPVPRSPIDQSVDRQIRVRLLGLDHRGIHVLELEKLHPGPFGFYISTGIYKRKKGVFISRVTASCLIPLLSIGDEIVEVDGISVKNKVLEQVQGLISDKEKITLKIFPVIMR